MAMTERRARFVLEYVIDLNATQAAIRAGYSEDTAYSQGARLLKDVEVSSAIDRELDAKAERTLITADRIMLEYAKIAFSSIGNYVERNEETGELVLNMMKASQKDLDAIAEYNPEEYFEPGIGGRRVKKIKIKLHNKLAALDSLSKLIGMKGAADTGKDAPSDGGVKVEIYLPDNGRGQ